MYAIRSYYESQPKAARQPRKAVTSLILSFLYLLAIELTRCFDSTPFDTESQDWTREGCCPVGSAEEELEGEDEDRQRNDLLDPVVPLLHRDVGADPAAGAVTGGKSQPHRPVDLAVDNENGQGRDGEDEGDEDLDRIDAHQVESYNFV